MKEAEQRRAWKGRIPLGVTLVGLLAVALYYVGSSYRSGWFAYWNIPSNLFPVTDIDLIYHGFEGGWRALYEFFNVVGSEGVVQWMHVSAVFILFLILIDVLLYINPPKIDGQRLRKNRVVKWMIARRRRHIFFLICTFLPILVAFILLIFVAFVHIPATEIYDLGYRHAEWHHKEMMNQVQSCATWHADGEVRSGSVVLCSNTHCAVLDQETALVLVLDQVTKIRGAVGKETLTCE